MGTTSTRVAREKKGRTETVDPVRPVSRSDFPKGARRPHCKRSDAAKSEVNEPVAAGSLTSTGCGARVRAFATLVPKRWPRHDLTKVVSELGGLAMENEDRSWIFYFI